MSIFILNYLTGPELVPVLALVGSLFLAWFSPRLGEAIFSRIELIGTCLARKKALAIVALALFPILVLLAARHKWEYVGKLAMGLPVELCLPQENNTPLRNEHLTEHNSIYGASHETRAT